MSSITKQGQFILNVNNLKYLINNFSESNITTDWTFGGTSPTLSNGIEILTGATPNITSATFTVNPTDIICFEFTLTVPTVSTKTSGGGIYLGTKSGQTVYVHTFNHTTKTWSQSTSTTTNPYFVNSYNTTNTLIIKNYILGSDVSLTDVPWGKTTNTSFPARAIQLSSGLTSTNIRSGYNSGNSEMVIYFSNPQIYNIYQNGFHDNDNILIASIGKGWSNANNFYEY